MTYFTIKYGPGQGKAVSTQYEGDAWARYRRALAAGKSASLYRVHPDGSTDRLAPKG